MTSFKPGDVVLVPFPFTNLASSKQRPCLVVSAEVFNENHDDVVLIALTSQIPEKLQADEMQLSTVQQDSAGLLKPSILQTR